MLHWRSSIRDSSVLIFVLTIAAAAACDSPVAPASLEGPPDELEFSISSLEGGYGTSTRLEGGEIIVVQLSWDGPPADTTRVVPTAEAWRAFWDAADAAGIHRWRSRYVDEDIVDGVGWSLTIRAGRLDVRLQRRQKPQPGRQSADAARRRCGSGRRNRWRDGWRRAAVADRR